MFPMPAKDWEVLDKAPMECTFRGTNLEGVPAGPLWFRVRRWPKGNRCRIEINGDPDEVAGWLWIGDADIDHHGFLKVVHWNLAPTGSMEGASYILGLAQAHINLRAQKS